MKNHHRSRRAVLALVTTVASLVALANPTTAATTNVTWRITGGHVLTHWNAVTNVFPNGEQAVCAPPDDGVDATVVVHHDDANHTTHIANGTAYAGFDPFDFTIGGTPYRMSIVGANLTTTGSYDPATNTMTQLVAFRINVQNCAGTTTLCTVTITGHLSGSDYSGGTLPTTGDTVTLTGSQSIVPHIGCNVALRAIVLGSTVTMLLHLQAT